MGRAFERRAARRRDSLLLAAAPGPGLTELGRPDFSSAPTPITIATERLQWQHRCQSRTGKPPGTPPAITAVANAAALTRTTPPAARSLSMGIGIRRVSAGAEPFDSQRRGTSEMCATPTPRSARPHPQRRGPRSTVPTQGTVLSSCSRFIYRARNLNSDIEGPHCRGRLVRTVIMKRILATATGLVLIGLALASAVRPPRRIRSVTPAVTG